MGDRIVMRRKLLLTGAALTAGIGAVLTGVMSGPRLSAQPSGAPIVASPSGPKFEVASIRPASTPPANYGIKIDAGRVTIGSWSIRQLILRAYGLPSYQLSAPDWTADLRFDVAAKFPQGATQDQLPEMLQWLLADRFGFESHVETKELSGFALVVGKGGPKMKPAVPDPDAPRDTPSPNRLEHAGQLIDRLASNDPKAFGVVSMTPVAGALRMEFKRLPMEALVRILADRLKAPVINLTGLDEDYHVTLDLPGPGAPTEMEPMSVSLSSAVEGLGLKLERRKTPLSLLVVDHVNRAPTEN